MNDKFAGKEPSAEHREAAKQAFGLFSAMVKEGFTEAQAERMITEMLSAAMSGK